MAVCVDLEFCLEVSLECGDLVVLGIFLGGRGGEFSLIETTKESSRTDDLLAAVDRFGTMVGSRTTPGNEGGHEEETT